MKLPRSCYLLLILPALLAAGFAVLALGIVPALRFTRERIDIAVRSSSIEVTGLYVYRNPWPISMKQRLFYPFPVDGSHPAPSWVQVTQVDPRTSADLGEIPTDWRRGTPRFSVSAPAGGEVHVRVMYQQSSTIPSASYILLTTKLWKRPLEFGEYYLWPQGVRITRSSYPLDGAAPLSFVRRDFMPDQDWRFTWQGS